MLQWSACVLDADFHSNAVRMHTTFTCLCGSWGSFAPACLFCLKCHWKLLILVRPGSQLGEKETMYTTSQQIMESFVSVWPSQQLYATDNNPLRDSGFRIQSRPQEMPEGTRGPNLCIRGEDGCREVKMASPKSWQLLEHPQSRSMHVSRMASQLHLSWHSWQVTNSQKTLLGLQPDAKYVRKR